MDIDRKRTKPMIRPIRMIKVMISVQDRSVTKIWSECLDDIPSFSGV